MFCENHFCIYQTAGKCSLTEVRLDIAGGCQNCIYPSIAEEYLQQEKLKLLQNYQEKT